MRGGRRGITGGRQPAPRRSGRNRRAAGPGVRRAGPRAGLWPGAGARFPRPPRLLI